MPGLSKKSTYEQELERRKIKEQKSFEHERLMLRALFVRNQEEADKMIVEMIANQMIINPRDEALIRNQIRNEIASRLVDEGIESPVADYYGCRDMMGFWQTNKS